MRIRTAALSTLFLSLLALQAAPAQAKSPPKGKYECTIGSDHLLFGAVTIKAGGKYRYSRSGKTGRFVAGKTKRTFSGSVRGYSIRFRGGGFNGYKGYWFTSSSGQHEIALARRGSTFVNIYCDD